MNPDQDTSPSKVNGELAAAHELFRKEKYSDAASKFRRVSENKSNSAAVAEEAMYYEGECMRLHGKLTDAEGIYKKQLNQFPSGDYKQQGCQRLYDIAIEWLKDTDKEMNDYKQGKDSFVIPAALRINLDSSKPTLDAETRRLQALEVVHYSDITGPLADKAVFLCGYVKFFREDYREADTLFHAGAPVSQGQQTRPAGLRVGDRVQDAGGRRLGLRQQAARQGPPNDRHGDEELSRVDEG